MHSGVLANGSSWYLADPEVTTAEIPPEFQGNLWTTNATQLLNSVTTAINNANTNLYQIQGKYHTRYSRNYVVTLTCISGGVYSVSNPDWYGLGYFDGHSYVGFYQYKHAKNEPDPSTWGGTWGLHRAKLDLQSGSLVLNGIELGHDGEGVKSFSGAWLRVNEDGE